jgi:[ribosomal protein S5]-alanine N-acetyltransferase
MLHLNFSPFPELQTSRLLLRMMNLKDAPEIFFLRSDPEVLKYLSRAPAKELSEAEAFIRHINNEIINNNHILWAIALKEDPLKLIGTITFWQIHKEHFRAELGYVLHPAHWKKGIMKEAVKAVIDFGFNIMKLHSIEARIHPANLGSAALLLSTGFTRDAYFREDFYFNGKFEDTEVYSLLQVP